MSTTVTVHIVSAKNVDGVRVELAKYFERDHADAHVAERFARAKYGWSDVQVESRDEHAAAQHAAHQPLFVGSPTADDGPNWVSGDAPTVSDEAIVVEEAVIGDGASAETVEGD